MSQDQQTSNRRRAPNDPQGSRDAATREDSPLDLATELHRLAVLNLRQAQATHSRITREEPESRGSRLGDLYATMAEGATTYNDLAAVSGTKRKELERTWQDERRKREEAEKKIEEATATVAAHEHTIAFVSKAGVTPKSNAIQTDVDAIIAACARQIPEPERVLTCLLKEQLVTARIKFLTNDEVVVIIRDAEGSFKCWFGAKASMTHYIYRYKRWLRLREEQQSASGPIDLEVRDPKTTEVCIWLKEAILCNEHPQ